MDLQEMVNSLKRHPMRNTIGMIASHLGIVRGTSRDGRPVTEIEVVYDRGKIQRIIEDVKKRSGIVEISVGATEGRLKIGDEILAVVVAGDIRENVFPALIETVNRIKVEASRKKEFFEQPGN
jgi:molybdopterin synthase catalytic subunit